MDLQSIHITTVGQMGALARGAKVALEHQLVYFRITWGRSEKGLTWAFLLSQPPKGILVHSCQDWVTGPGCSEIRISVLPAG